MSFLSFSLQTCFFSLNTSLSHFLSRDPSILFMRPLWRQRAAHATRMCLHWCHSREDLALLRPGPPPMWSWLERCQTRQRYVILLRWITARAHLWSERQVIPLSPLSLSLTSFAISFSLHLSQGVLERTTGTTFPSSPLSVRYTWITCRHPGGIKEQMSSYFLLLILLPIFHFKKFSQNMVRYTWWSN